MCKFRNLTEVSIILSTAWSLDTNLVYELCKVFENILFHFHRTKNVPQIYFHAYKYGKYLYCQRVSKHNKLAIKKKINVYQTFENIFSSPHFQYFKMIYFCISYFEYCKPVWRIRIVV